MKNLNKHENGVALLFALGLLSLMSVLGVAFVANSLTAQKTAVNLGARNQAQIVLDSAVNRIMITLMALLRQDQTTTDFSVIYSTNDGNARTADADKLNTYDQLSDATN
jgi:type II secretory pathway component PulK